MGAQLVCLLLALAACAPPAGRSPRGARGLPGAPPHAAPPAAATPAPEGEPGSVRVMPQQVGLRCWQPLAFSPANDRLLVGAFECTDEAVADRLAIAEWDLRTGALLRLIDSRERWVEAVYLPGDRHALIRARYRSAVLDLDDNRWRELEVTESSDEVARRRDEMERRLEEMEKRLDQGPRRGAPARRRAPPQPPAPERDRRGHAPTDSAPPVLSTDGRHLLTPYDDEVVLWDLTGARDPRRIAAARDQRREPAFALAADGSRVFVEGPGHAIAVVDAATGTASAPLPGHAGWINALQAIPGGPLVVSAADDGVARLWDWQQGQLVRTFDHGAPISRLVVGAGGRQLATINEAGWPGGGECLPPAFKLWDLASGRLLMSAAVDCTGLESLQLCPDGRHAFATLFQEAAIYEVATGKELRRIDDTRTTLSPDCSRLAAWRGRGVAILDPVSGAELLRLEGSAADAPAQVAALPAGLQALLPSGNTPPGAPMRGSARLQWNAGGAAPPRSLLRVWDFDRLRPAGALAARDGLLAGAALAGDRRVLTSGYDGTVALWDLASGTRLWEQRQDQVARVAISAGSDRLVWSHGNQLVIAGGDGAELRRVDAGARIEAVHLAADGGRALVATAGKLAVVDTGSGATVRAAASDSEHWWFSAASPDLRRAVLVAARRDPLFGGHDIHGGSWRPAVELWDLESGVRLHQAGGSHVAAVALHPDGAHVFAGGEDGRIHFWRADTAASITKMRIHYQIGDGADDQNSRWLLAGHTGRITGLAVSADGRYLMSTSADRTTRLWRLDTGASIALVTSGDQWVVYSDDGTFDASRHGGDLVMAVAGGRTAHIDQLALRNNRPDLLLSRMGLGTPELVAHYRARHQRRLRKLGLDERKLTASFARAPQATIRELRQTGKRARLEVELSSEHGELAGYNVWVNDVPLHGVDGRAVAGRRRSVTETIELTAGRNKIEVGARDRGGAESLRDVRTLAYAGEAPGDLYFLGFGVSRYRNRSLDLRFAHKDVLDLAGVIAGMRGHFRAVHVRTWVDEEVTVDAIRAATGFLARAGVDDTVILMVAGHGTYGRDDEATYYFVTHETDPARLRETAAPFELFEELLQGIAPRRKLFLMDTCESGERDDDDELPAPAAGGRGLRARSSRALVFRAGGRPAPPRPFLFDRDRYIYNDVVRRSGAIVLSSSRGAELSYELDALENGAFTEAILRALTSPAADADRDGAVSTDELTAFVVPAVAASTGALQHPTVDRDNLTVQLRLPITATPAAARGSPPAPRSPRGCGCSQAGAADLPAVLLVLLAGAAAGRRRPARIRASARPASPPAASAPGPSGRHSSAPAPARAALVYDKVAGPTK